MRIGAEGFVTASAKLGTDNTLEALVVEFEDLVDADVVSIATDRLGAAPDR